jgi:hypothetical protein
VVGLSVIGIDELVSHVRTWEQQADGSAASGGRSEAGAAVTDADQQSQADLALSSAEAAPRPVARPREAPAAADSELRYALIGWLFTSERRLQLDGGFVHRLQSASQLMAGTAVTIVRRALLSPRRGQRAAGGHDDGRLEQWIALGRVEEARSRRLASVAMEEIVDGVIGYMAGKPEIRDLVLTQGTGFARDIAEGVRDRSADADTFLEGVARSLFRRPPRTPAAELPAQPERSLPPRPIADTGQVP